VQRLSHVRFTLPDRVTYESEPLGEKKTHTVPADYREQMVGGIKTALFGGEGLFFAVLRGPGKVWLQSLPFSRLAGRIYAAAPQKGGAREEGSVLGGLGRLVRGDHD
jgi:hypothetical protein